MMGTNYYVASDLCECCNRYDRKYHIGKSSWGWAFSFQGYRHDNLTSWKLWKEFLKDQSIKDEYGETVPFDDFVAMVEGPKAPGFVRSDGHKNLSHNEAARADHWFNPNYDWDDEDGYSFCSRDFS